MNGIIVRLYRGRGFGFIRRERDAEEFFFHCESVRGVDFDELAEGVAVIFEESPSAKGPRARNVARA